MVGSTIAYASMIKDLAAEIILIDVNKQRQEGEVLDLSHGAFGTDTGGIYNGDYTDCRNVDVIVITAGASQKPGQTRLELIEINAGILRDIAESIGEIQQHTKILVVSNPVDVLTMLAKEIFPVSKNQIFGSGTYLDTSRLRLLLSQKLQISAHNTHAYVIGEHGDSAFVPWSIATAAGGRKIQDILSEEERNEIEQGVRKAAYEIISKKGSTYYGIGIVVAEILESILFNKKKVITVSTIPGAGYGITDICLGIPSIISANGIESVWQLSLEESEIEKLQNSAGLLSEAYRSISR